MYKRLAVTITISIAILGLQSIQAATGQEGAPGSTQQSITTFQGKVNAQGQLVDLDGRASGRVMMINPSLPFDVSKMSIQRDGSVILNSTSQAVGRVEFGTESPNTVPRTVTQPVMIPQAAPPVATPRPVAQPPNSLQRFVFGRPSKNSEPAAPKAVTPGAAITPGTAARGVSSSSLSQLTVDAAGNVRDSSGNVVGYVAARRGGGGDLSGVSINSRGNAVSAQGKVVGRLVMDGQSASDFTRRRAKLDARINQELSEQRLNSDQANRLRQEIQAAISTEARFKKDGEVTDRETERLYAMWDRIMEHMDQFLAGNARLSVGLRTR